MVTQEDLEELGVESIMDRYNLSSSVATTVYTTRRYVGTELTGEN